MTISTWNIRHGGGKRIKEIVRVLSENVTDILVLTEYRQNSNQEYLQEELIKIGYKYHYHPISNSTQNTVLIASRLECEVEIFDVLEGDQHRILKVSNEYCTLYGCYFPIKKLKVPLFEFLLGELREYLNDKPIILTGDFNTGKHFSDEKGKTFYGSEYFDKFEELQLVDAWRYIHEERKEFSWYSNAGNGFRLDHFFIHSNWKNKIENCQYIHSCREAKISDHSLMKLELR